MKRLLFGLALPALLCAPAFCGVTIEYDVTQSIGPAGRAMQTRHTHSYTRSAARADVAMQGPIQLDIADAVIKTKQPYITMKLGSGAAQRTNIHDYEDSALPNAIVTPSGQTKTIIGCKTTGYKFTSKHISGMFWVCSAKEWSEVAAFTASLLTTLDSGTEEFGLYKQLLKQLPKN